MQPQLRGRTRNTVSTTVRTCRSVSGPPSARPAHANALLGVLLGVGGSYVPAAAAACRRPQRRWPARPATAGAPADAAAPQSTTRAAAPARAASGMCTVPVDVSPTCARSHKRCAHLNQGVETEALGQRGRVQVQQRQQGAQRCRVGRHSRGLHLPLPPAHQASPTVCVSQAVRLMPWRRHPASNEPAAQTSAQRPPRRSLAGPSLCVAGRACAPRASATWTAKRDPMQHSQSLPSFVCVGCDSRMLTDEKSQGASRAVTPLMVPWIVNCVRSMATSFC